MAATHRRPQAHQGNRHTGNRWSPSIDGLPTGTRSHGRPGDLPAHLRRVVFPPCRPTSPPPPSADGTPPGTPGRQQREEGHLGEEEHDAHGQKTAEVVRRRPMSPGTTATRTTGRKAPFRRRTSCAACVRSAACELTFAVCSRPVRHAVVPEDLFLLPGRRQVVRTDRGGLPGPWLLRRWPCPHRPLRAHRSRALPGRPRHGRATRGCRPNGSRPAAVRELRRWCNGPQHTPVSRDPPPRPP